MVYTALFGVVLAYAAFGDGGGARDGWAICLLVLGALAVAYWLTARRAELAPALEREMFWPAVLLPAYAALQTVPLPLAVIRLISPARAELAEAAGERFTPLSVTPAATEWLALTLLAYLAAFLLARELAWRAPERRWRLALPVVTVAALEAALGILQSGEGVVAHGTYVNRNHFAGLLEMALPFAAVYAAMGARRAWRRETRRAERSSLWPALQGCAGLAGAALLITGTICSQSRMGFMAALFGLLAAALAGAGAREPGPGIGRWKRWAAAGAAGAVVLGSFVYLPTDPLIARFGKLGTEELSSDTRSEIWRETAGLIEAYPVFGCGLGGYEAAFLKYKTVAPLYTVDYAHNDYLQGLAELGAIGFLLAAVFVGGAARRILRGASGEDERQRYFALACAGAMAAILLHSTADFNLYMPANAVALAWICGAGLGPARSLGNSGVIEVEAALTGIHARR